MTERQQLGEDLDWHVIHGAPYFIREKREGIFRIIRRTSVILKDGIWCMGSELDPNLLELVLNEDIYEFHSENNVLGFLASVNSKYDFSVVRGLRHLARLEGALYVTFQSIGENKCIGTHINSLKSDLVLARFFNRKYDMGIDYDLLH